MQLLTWIQCFIVSIARLVVSSTMEALERSTDHYTFYTRRANYNSIKFTAQFVSLPYPYCFQGQCWVAVATVGQTGSAPLVPPVPCSDGRCHSSQTWPSLHTYASTWRTTDEPQYTPIPVTPRCNHIHFLRFFKPFRLKYWIPSKIIWPTGRNNFPL